MRSLVQTSGGDHRLSNKLLSCVFYEASTRTSCSFQAAMLRLGGKVIMIDASAQGNTSASKKGETLSDTIRCLECYSDVTVLRHPIQGSVEDVVRNGATKPIINAGDGVGEHPTQALLDLFTILDEWKMLTSPGVVECCSTEPFVVVMLGDLKHGRTVHSLAKLLAQASCQELWKRPLHIKYCSPKILSMPQYVQDYVKSCHSLNNPITQEVCFGDEIEIEKVVEDAHVLYVTRVQKERFEDVNEYEAVKVRWRFCTSTYHMWPCSCSIYLPYYFQGAYVVNEKLMSKAPPQMIVMHPLPRVDEIAVEVDVDPRAAYFRQMENGMYVRMAILALVLGGAS
jgi:carbamoyl-phosphate synthase/aspartate carbamoyltransferase/dihydroorotase